MTINPLKVLRRHLKQDDKWQRFEIIYNEAYKPEFNDYITEIKDLHRTRSLRLIGAQASPTARKIGDAAMRDQAVRSRCVEIVINVTHSRNRLAIAMNTVSSYLTAEYSSTLQELGIRTIADRRTTIESLFGRAQRRLDELDTITEIADHVIKDVDQGSFTIKHLVTAVEIATKRESSY